MLPDINMYITLSSEEDEMSHLFKKYHRWDWSLRLTSLNMVAERFVVSGGTLHQWLVIRHLADLYTSYPRDIIDYFEHGGLGQRSKRGSNGVTI